MKPRKGKDHSHIHTGSKSRIFLGKSHGPLNSAGFLPPCSLTVRLSILNEGQHAVVAVGLSCSWGLQTEGSHHHGCSLPRDPYEPHADRFDKRGLYKELKRTG